VHIDKEKKRTRIIKVKTIVEDWLLSIVAAVLIVTFLLICVVVIQLLQHDAYRVIQDQTQQEIHFQKKHLIGAPSYDL